MEDLGQKADVCVFELFDSQLLGESILPILRDARRLLRSDCVRGTSNDVNRRDMAIVCVSTYIYRLPICSIHI